MPDGTQDTTTTTQTASADATTQATDKGDTTTTVDKGATTTADKATDASSTTTTAKTDWPDDWRQKISADDKTLKALERYTSPKAVAEALLAAQQKIRSGELKTQVAFPAKGSDEDKAAWRKDNGIPEAADKYDLKFDSGLVIGDDQKPLVDGFLKAAHEANLPPTAVKTAVEWYYKTIEERAQAQQELDSQTRQETEDALRAEWGGDYRGNVNRVKALVQMAPPEVAEQIMGARLPDGTALFNNPEALRWWAGIARVINPATTVVPGDGQAAAGQIDARLDELNGWMAAPKGSADWKKYWKDNKVQAEWRALKTQQERMKQ